MKFKIRSCATLFLAALLLVTHSRAMSINAFGRLNTDDAATYVTLLVESSAKMLKSTGKQDQAQKLVALFKDSSKQGGLNQFVSNLRAINSENNLNGTNPRNPMPVLEVEDAMAMTFRQNGVVVSVDYLKTVSQGYRPEGPPRQFPPVNGFNH